VQLRTKSRAWTAIDCGDGPTWCAVNVKTSVHAGARPRVNAAIALPNPGADGETAALKEILRRIDSRSPVLVTLPRSQYRMRVMAEPPVPDRDMQASLRWAVAADSDDPHEDVNLAWMRIPTDEAMPARPRQLYAMTTSKVWLAAQMAVWKQAGLKPRVVDVQETALRNVAARLEQGDDGALLVAPDDAGVGMVFTHRGSLFFNRYIEQPSAEWRAAPPDARARSQERMAAQVHRSIEVVERTFPFMPVRRVVVAPSPEPVGLLEVLASQLPLPVEPLDLGRLFDLNEAPDLAQSTTLQSHCLVALGATLRGGAH
jgi:MSHA biogenesis protein MshI